MNAYQTMNSHNLFNFAFPLRVGQITDQVWSSISLCTQGERENPAQASPSGPAVLTPCSPCVFADGRDERDGAGRLRRHWSLSPNGRAREGCLHAPASSWQPSEHLHPLTLLRFSLLLLLPLFFFSPSSLSTSPPLTSAPLWMKETLRLGTLLDHAETVIRLLCCQAVNEYHAEPAMRYSISLKAHWATM